MVREIHITHPETTDKEVYTRVNYLQTLMYLIANPVMAFLGYNPNPTKLPEMIKKFEDDAAADDVVAKLRDFQQQIFDEL